MAPLFGQRQKAQDDLATPSQTQTHAGSGENGRVGSSANVSGHYMTTSSGTHHHPSPTNPPHLTTGNKDGGHHHHHQRQGAPPPLPMRQQPGLANDTSHGTGTTKGDTAALRKYLVLLQDCLAIKFAPLVNGHQSHPYPFAFNNKQKNCCGEILDDEEDELASHRRDNFYSHRVSSSANGPKNGSNSINEPHANRSLHANSLGNHNSSNNSHQHQHINFHLGNNNHNNGSIHDNNEDPQQAFNLPSHHQQKSRRRETFHFLESQSGGTTLNRPASCNFSGAEGFLGSNTAEVDHSLHGLYLYKGFKEANVQCYWNAALSETFRNIQYKGYIVPSTILVGALPKFLSILRTAWSRQMLRSPAGYRIDFIGEIEEVIADPIQKGQFAPLSDSLCWAILELTSLGQEAFVDSIMSALQIAFPTMSCPSRELVFQTLEKLIKERKVYQTSRGYFVVTPDIFRYMVSGNFHEVDAPTTPFLRTNAGTTLDALLHPNCQENDKSSFSHQSWDSAGSTGDRNRCSSTSTGEELIEIPPSPKLKRHNSLKMIRQRDNAVTQMSSSTGQRRHSLRLPKSKSCGRVNDAGEDDEEVKTSKVKSSTMGHISRAMRSLRTGGTPNPTSTEAGDSEKSKKNKSLLSKLFPFRRSTSKPRNEKSVAATSVASPSVVDTSAASGLAANPPPPRTTTISSSNGSMSPPTKVKHSENAKDSAKFISTQTQTSNSTEQLCVPSITLLASSPPPHPGACTMRAATNNEKNAGRMTGEPSTDDSSPDNVLHHQTCLNGDGGSHQTRPSSRRSMSILDESPLYDVLQDVPSSISPHHHHHHHHQHISPNFQVGCPVGPPIFPGFHHHRGESSRCSTLSSQAASSLGYGSQAQPSLLSNYSPNMDSGLASYGYYIGDSSNSNSHSPCPSTGAYGNNVPPSQQYYHQNHNGSNGGTTFPQPAKPTAYSSARYKNSYEWYRKRYPNYISPVGRSSPLYASLTAPRSKSRSRSTYESLLTPTNEKHHNGGGRNMHVSENTCKFPPAGSNNQDGGMMSNTNNANSSDMRQSQQDGSVSTTTVTQAVKSTTNMELELLLPLGKIMKAALHAKKDAIREAWLRDEMGPAYAAYADRAKQSNQPTGSTSSNNNESIKVNLDNSGAKLRVGEPSTKTEVTTVVNNNGVIETHFDSSSGINQPLADLTPQNMKSTVEIKTLGGVTDVVLVNGKTGEETKIISAGGHQRKQRQNSGSKAHHHHQHQPILSKLQTSDNNAYEKILDKRSSASACVKISDIGKDCGTEEDIIKVC